MADEYIRKEDAISAARHAWAKELEPSQYIELITPVDAVPVVRCKDCTFYVVNGCEDYCRKNQHFWDAEKDFCSCGERREE